MKDMEERSRTCGLCKRPIKPQSPHVEGLGFVGPECYERVRGLERAFALLARPHPYHVARALRANLRALGFNARTTQLPSGAYVVQIKRGVVTEAGYKLARSAYTQNLIALAERFAPAAA